MKVTVHYMAQLRSAAGRTSEAVELPAPCTAAALVAHLAARHGAPLCDLLLNADGRPQPTLLVFVGDEQADFRSAEPLPDGAAVTLLTPIAGGGGGDG